VVGGNLETLWIDGSVRRQMRGDTRPALASPFVFRTACRTCSGVCSQTRPSGSLRPVYALR
jgi:hypothetical protein